MRIFGGHDYYDVGLSLGIDPTIVLVRGKSLSVDVKEAGGTLLKHEVEVQPERSNGLSSTCVAVVLCTKVYRGVLVNHMGGTECFWSLEKLREWAAARKMVVDMKRSWSVHRKGYTVEQYFAVEAVPPVLREYMISKKYSILVEMAVAFREPTVFAVNPATLKRIGFAKAVDPYTAFQELSMWIGGVLGGTSPEMVKITDDKVLAESHGFDKESFRGPRIK